MKMMNCRMAIIRSGFRGSFSVMNCADTCPQFGDPFEAETSTSSSQEKIIKTYLSICQGKVLYFDEFTDER